MKFVSFLKCCLSLILYLLSVTQICRNFRELQKMSAYNDGPKAAATLKIELVMTIVLNNWQLCSNYYKELHIRC